MANSKTLHDHTVTDENDLETEAMPDAFLADMVPKILQTKEFEEILHILIPGIVNRWAGTSTAKKIVSRPIKSHILKSFTRSNGRSPSLFKDPDLTCDLLESIPTLLDVVIKSLHEVLKTIETLPSKDKEEVLGKILSKMNGAETGAAFTSAVRIANEIHNTHPTFLADHFKASFEKWVESVDFGEIKDFADSSHTDILALMKNVNDALWNYPAKPVLLAALIPAMVNLALGVLQDTMARFNNFPPDLLADVLLSMLRELDGRHIGQLVNELTEFARKSHTGSALIGDPSSPKFPDDLSRLLEETLNTIDVKRLWKGVDAVRDGKGSIKKVWLELLRDNPHLVVEMVERYPSALNARISGMNRKVALVEALPEEEVAEVAEKGISALNLSDLADTINMLCMMANRIRKQKPDVITSMIGQFADSVDLFELEDTLKWLTREVLVGLKPVGRLVAPQIVVMLSEWLAPDGNGSEYDE
ncbi:MAG: hypothetical protein H8E81_06185 [Deltaproteobacteria bacterium]|nr:hypothetical protein [Deltaproteobacteria bacterium]